MLTCNDRNISSFDSEDLYTHIVQITVLYMVYNARNIYIAISLSAVSCS